MANTNEPTLDSLLRCLVIGYSNLDQGEQEFRRKAADIIEQLLIKNELMQDRLAKAEKDSERLDWIDSQTCAGVNLRGNVWMVGWKDHAISGIDFRSAIDAAKGAGNG